MTKAEEITSLLKDAMRNKDKFRLEALREIRAEILKIEKTSVKTIQITDEQFIALVKKLVKERKESFQIAQDNNRQETAKEEKVKLEILQSFLPSPLGLEELNQIIERAINNCQANSPKDMGKVMKEFKQILEGVSKDVDMQIASKMIKDKLNS